MLCHVLGGAFNLPHAEAHAIVLPHALAYNAQAVPDAIVRIKRAIGRDAPTTAFFELNATFGAPTALRDLGMPEDGINRVVKLALNDSHWNPRPLETDGRQASENAPLKSRRETLRRFGTGARVAISIEAGRPYRDRRFTWSNHQQPATNAAL